MAAILCAAKNTDFKGYALNPDFEKLPDEIKEKLKKICAGFVESVGGVFIIQFEEDGTPQFVTEKPADEAGAEERIRKLQKDEAEFWVQLKLFYRIFVLHEDPNDFVE